MKIFLILLLAVRSDAYLVPGWLSDFNMHFTISVYQEILKQNQYDNILFSPFSAQLNIAVLSLGAVGTTVDQLTEAAQLNSDLPLTKWYFENQLNDIDDDDNTTNIINLVYVHNSIPIKTRYKNEVRCSLHTEIKYFNNSNPTELVEDINKKVEDATNHMIKNVIGVNEIYSSSLILINAVLFHNVWNKPFSNTAQDYFYINDNEKVLVDYLSNSDYVDYHYSSILKTEFIRIPFEKNGAFLVLVLPHDKNGLTKLESRINNVFDKLFGFKYHRTLIDYAFPKFKIESTVDFAAILKSRGAVEAFTPNATFNVISDGQISLSALIQKNYIDINENGVLVGTATPTESVMSRSDVKRVIVNHPFIYYIEHPVFKVIYAGRVINPAKNDLKTELQAHL